MEGTHTKPKLDRRADQLDHAKGLYKYFKPLTHEEALKQMEYQMQKSRELRDEQAESQQIRAAESVAHQQALHRERQRRYRERQKAAKNSENLVRDMR
jgi:hypothetical protein